MSRLYTKQLGPYELVRRLGHGGMAETFLGVRRGPGEFVQEVCIKRLLPHRAAEPSTVRAFLREAHLVASLNHPNIVRILELGEAGGEHYLALELVDGLDLRALLRARTAMRKPLPAPLVAYLAVQLSSALHAAHGAVTSAGSRGIFHRDLSPENVLLGRAGEVKLTDFGIARPVEHHSTTATGVVKGKADYMAPEYANTGEFDTRCDQFSLGVVLYECLTGCRPHQGRTEIEVLQRAGEGAHAPAREVVPSVPAALSDFVETLLAPDPTERFESPDALLDAAHALEPPLRAARELAELVDALRPLHNEQEDHDGLPTAAQRTATIEGVLSGRTRRARWAWVAAVVLASAGLVAGALTWREGGSPDASEADGQGGDAAGPWKGDEATAASLSPPSPAEGPSTRAPLAETARAVEPATKEAEAEATDGMPDPEARPRRAVVERRDRRHSPRTKAADAAPATLEVVVVPFGKVWVDGELRGEAPVTLPLASGAHRIQVGRKTPTVTQRVRLAPAERKQLVLTL